MSNFNDIIGKALDLPEPWFVADTKFDHASKTLDIFLAFKKGSLFPCPECGLMCPVYDTKERTWRHLDFFDYKTTFHANLPRVNCEGHGTKTIEIKWSEKGSKFTLQFEALLLSFAREMSVAAVATLMRIHQNSVWRILERYVMREVRKMNLSGIRIVGVDEFAVGKGHNYVSIFGDLSGEQPKLVYIVEGKDNTVIEAFKERLGTAFKDGWFKDMIFCVDMSHAYRMGIMEQFPGARLVFDKFHIMVKANEAVNDVRKCEVIENDKLIGTKYLFMKNPENLTDSEMSRLRSIKDLDMDTTNAYHFKLALQRFWRFDNLTDATMYLRKWLAWTSHSKLLPIVKIGKMIKFHWDGVINSFRYKLSSGPMEGLVNKIKTAVKRAYGFKTLKNLEIISYLMAGDIELPTRS
jgi:transposase